MILYADVNSPKRVYINEDKIGLLANSEVLSEGIDWSVSDDGSINMSVNQKMDNNSNRGKNSVDTRVFGTKNDILNGKITTKTGKDSGNSKSLYQYYIERKSAYIAYENVIKWVTNGRVGNLELPKELDKRTRDTIEGWVKSGFSDNRIIDMAKKSMNRISSDVNQYTMTYNRINNSNNEDKTARYITGLVPDTNVKYISLFTMTDFNFSDAIKHGQIRQNGNTDDIIGINRNGREKDNHGNLTMMDITYDNGIKPDIAQNFSLKDVKPQHYKQNYGLNGGGKYSSVAQFLDKSVNYAAYALRSEQFIPDVIVSAPSSSKFNSYYCKNLSNKLGIPYISDFFKRNVINVKYADGQDLLSKGFSPKDVFEFESQAKNIAYNEIGHIVSTPIRKLIYDNPEIFGNISLKKHSRDKVSLEEVFDCTMIYAYQTILEDLNKDTVSKHIVRNFLKERKKLYNKKYDSTHIFNEVSFRIKTKIGQKVFNNILLETTNLVLQYSDILKNKGYKLRFNVKRFKITSFKKMFRPFLSNIYIIADEYMNNGELMNRFKNAKFLIFDEDINSGTTMKIVIDALEEKLPEQNENNIMCLVNAYSGSGY